MADNFVLSLQDNQNLSLDLNSQENFTLQSETPLVGGTSDYERLRNKPQINGITLQGNQLSSDLHIVSENTEYGWEQMPDYVPKTGEICVYTDTSKIKIGDGIVPIVDLPYITNDGMDELSRSFRAHKNNYEIHIDEEEREFWNNKLNYSIIGETLTLNRY